MGQSLLPYSWWGEQRVPLLGHHPLFFILVLVYLGFSLCAEGSLPQGETNNGNGTLLRVRRAPGGTSSRIKFPMSMFQDFLGQGAPVIKIESSMRTRLTLSSGRIRFESPLDGSQGEGGQEGSIVVSADSTFGMVTDSVLSSLEGLSDQIRILDESLTLFMNQKRRPTTEGGFSLLPMPNYAFIPDLGPLRQLFQWGSRSIRSYATCHACRVAFGLFLLKSRTQTSLEALLQKTIYACTFFQLAAPEVCLGLVNLFGPILHYIGKSRSELTADMFCGMVLQASGCSSPTLNSNAQWSIDLSLYDPTQWSHNELRRHGPRLNVPTSSTRINSGGRIKFGPVPVILPSQTRTLKVLHLTDIHVDPQYEFGSDATCATELCCRVQDGIPSAPEDQAGYFGDYRRCDLPFHSLENALHHISRTHPDIELIYMTGDLVPHNVWSSSRAANIGIIQSASKLIRSYFPNTRVIPVFGNHDVHPVNMYTPKNVPREFSTDWIYTEALKAWGDWIPRDSIHTFLHGGYYTVPITPTFRVIVLNTNLCYTFNFWQVFEDRDPSGQLYWLAKELQKSEERGEQVHILGHVPPGQEECWTVWSRNFYKIINRFNSIIKGQFYGHTHYDEFQLYYHEEDKGRAINPLWLGASLTPFTNLNPGYKLFNVDGSRGFDSTWNVLDHETWIYNLTDANRDPTGAPKWFRLYKATEAYGLPDVLPHSLNQFVHRMSSNLTAFNHYYRNYHKAAEVALKKTCDTFCRKRILCNIVTPYFEEQSECMNLQSEIDGIVLPKQIFERGPSQGLIGSNGGSGSHS